MQPAIVQYYIRFRSGTAVLGVLFEAVQMQSLGNPLPPCKEKDRGCSEDGSGLSLFNE